jgi:hypothetical protein
MLHVFILSIAAMLAAVQGDVKGGKMFVNLLHKEDEVLKSDLRCIINVMNVRFSVAR